MMDELDELVVTTKVAREEATDHRYLGCRLFADLLGNESITSLVALAISGKRCRPEMIPMLNDLAVVLCVADPKVWPLKVTRLVSSYGGTLPGLAAGTLCLEDAGIGPMVVGESAELLVRVHEACTGASSTDVKKRVQELMSEYPVLPGFGVPLREVDERVTSLTRRVRAHARDKLNYWVLFEKVCDVTKAEKHLNPNIGSAFAAAALDLGFRPRETAILAFVLTYLGCLVPNAVEASELRSRILKSLPPSKVKYKGVGPRLSPRARSRESFP